MSVDQGVARVHRRRSLRSMTFGERTGLTTREIATIAVLASLGGVMSAYVGYLGVLLNKLVGIPFGAGQFLAGLHVFWMVLAVVLTNRVGTGTATGALKGMVELLAGSSKGVLVLLLSLVAGLIVDLVWALAPRRGIVAAALAGGLATCSNIIVFLLFTSTYNNLLWLFFILLAVSFVSGVIFAGLLVWNVAGTLDHAGISVKAPGFTPDPGGTGPPGGGGTRGGDGRSWDRRTVVGSIVTVLVMVLLFGGAFSYYATTGQNVEDVEEGLVSVEGMVGNPYRFDLDEFAGDMVTVEAELQGQVTHVEMMAYTGVPLSRVLERAEVEEGARSLRVAGADGYGIQLEFDLEDVMDPESASGYILVEEHGTLPGGGTGDHYRLVCKDLDGGWWVRWVITITVE